MSDSRQEQVLLIDGNSLAFRAFFAMKAALRDDMTVEAGTSLFKKWLQKFVSEIDPDFLAIAFDVDNSSSENNKLFSDYKAGRNIDPLLKNNFKQFIQVPKDLDYYTLGLPGHEADDVVASLSAHFCNSRWNDRFKIDVISGDKDLLQLVNDQQSVKVLSPIAGTKVKVWTDATVKDKFKGISSSDRVADFKAIVGDDSDGYHGIPHIGLKTAEKLLNDYGSLDKIFEVAKDMSSDMPKRTRTILLEGEQHGRNSYKLAKLDKTVVLPIKKLGELRFKPEIDESSSFSR